MSFERAASPAEINAMVSKALRQASTRVPPPRDYEAEHRERMDIGRYEYEKRSGRYECP